MWPTNSNSTTVIVKSRFQLLKFIMILARLVNTIFVHYSIHTGELKNPDSKPAMYVGYKTLRKKWRKNLSWPMATMGLYFLTFPCWTRPWNYRLKLWSLKQGTCFNSGVQGISRDTYNITLHTYVLNDLQQSLKLLEYVQFTFHKLICFEKVPQKIII